MTTTTEETAAEAKRKVDQAEADLASGTRSISAAALNKLRDAHRHATLAAQGIRAKAERDREAARTAALEELGRQVDELAASPLAAELGEALRAVTAACERARQVGRDWDTALGGLIGAAEELGVGGPAPGGPAKNFNFLALSAQSGDQAITHRTVQLSYVSKHMVGAIEHAVIGRPEDGGALAGGVRTLEQRRTLHYLRNQSGAVLGMDAITDAIRAQIRSGELTELTEPQVRRYLEGEAA